MSQQHTVQYPLISGLFVLPWIFVSFFFFFSFFIIFFCFCLLCLTCIYYGARSTSDCLCNGGYYGYDGMCMLCPSICSCSADTLSSCYLPPYNLSTLLANKISPIPCPQYLILLLYFLFHVLRSSFILLSLLHFIFDI